MIVSNLAGCFSHAWRRSWVLSLSAAWSHVRAVLELKRTRKPGSMCCEALGVAEGLQYGAPVVISRRSETAARLHVRCICSEDFQGSAWMMCYGSGRWTKT
eukprot:3763443-Amphidinium_carterae.1